MPLDPELDALTHDLDDLATAFAPERPEIADARDAIRRAADVVSPGGRAAPAAKDADRALTLARMALDRAHRALDAPARRAEVDLDSEIPAAHPAKSAIEASIAGAFAGVKGRWRVAILVQPNAPWWGIRVEGASICWTGTLEGPDEQSPEFLAGRVREAVRLGLMQAALPRHRNRG